MLIPFAFHLPRPKAPRAKKTVENAVSSATLKPSDENAGFFKFVRTDMAAVRNICRRTVPVEKKMGLEKSGEPGSSAVNLDLRARSVNWTERLRPS